jgi:hypothetical protein
MRFSSPLCGFFNNHKKEALVVAGSGGLAAGIWGIVHHLSKNPDRANEIQSNFVNTITDLKYGPLLGVGVVAFFITLCYLMCRKNKPHQKNNGSVGVIEQKVEDDNGEEEPYFKVNLYDPEDVMEECITKTN